QPSVVYTAQTPSALDDLYEGRVAGYSYAREGHPNASVLAQKIDQMEGISGGIITSSGMGAVGACLLGLLKAGDHVVAGDQLYGRSYRMLKTDLKKFGVETTFADPTNAKDIRAALTPSTRMILVEVISNPTIRVADMEGIAKIAQDTGALLVVDNTFTTPRAYRPFEHGADVVIHSVTKLLAGHSDVTLGYVGAKDDSHRQAINDAAVTFGFTGSPFDCWLAERGLYSFELRYERAQQNAVALADAIAELPEVKRVLYPTRRDHPDHNRAARVLPDGGANMVSFEIHGGRKAADALCAAADNIAFAPTLGDVSTILSHPLSSSHRALTKEEQGHLGLSEGFFRVSVGVEPIDVLIEEFTAAIKASHSN
ncbi:MAG: aminotransferase class I/II-fold pyridoxal phosphate-dependent enzyme, partial [Pseudoruegeria sp.]